VSSKANSSPTTSAITSTTTPTSSTDAPMSFTRVASRTPKMLSSATTIVAATLSSCTWPRVGSAQISGANTAPIPADTAAVPAMNEISATQPVNQPMCEPASRLDHWYA
jgi:hypothetical protein